MLLVATGHVAEAEGLSFAIDTPQLVAKPQPVAERPDRVSAGLAARSQGSRVLITDETTETTLTYANPDGTTTLEASSSPVRVKQGERWADIDTTLVYQGGVLKPKASLADVTFSGGGDGKALASLKLADEQSYSLAWPSSLPQPKVEGDKATYADVAGPGADLVLTALPNGFRHDVVLRERPPGPVEYRIPVEVKGLTLAKTKQGGLKLTDAKNKTVASAPEPVMYEALATAPPQASKTAKAGAKASTGAIDTQVVKKNGRQELLLKPDPAYLADPETVFPVVVDPAITLVTQAERTILAPCRDGTQLSVTHLDGQETGIIEGFWNWDGCGDHGGNHTPARALLKFNTASLVGQQVVNARLDTVFTAVGYSGQPNCPTGRALQVRRLTGNWTPNNVRWSNQPATTTDGEIVTLPPAACTDDPNVTVLPWSIPITTFAQAWANGAPGHGLQLALRDERTNAGTFYWKFADVKLVVTSGKMPWTENLRTAPIVGNSGVFYSNSTTPTLFAGVQGSDGGVLNAEFEVEHDPADTAHGSGPIWNGAVQGVQAGEFAKVTLPAGKVADGWKIRWRARASDSATSSEWSPWQLVTIDTSAPKLVAGSTGCTHPEGSWKPRDWNGPSMCFMQSYDSDLAGFEWGLDEPNTPEWKPVEFGGSLEIPLDIASEGWHTVYIRARDKAHNTSPLWSMSFGIGAGGIVTAKHKSRTQRAVSLVSAAAPTWTQVTYEYRTGADDDPDELKGWTTVPASDVTVPGSSTPIGTWPQTRTDTSKDFAELSWDVAKTLRDAQYPDGAVAFRACFSRNGSADRCTQPAVTTLDRTAFGSSYATADVGPGTLALQTGDFSIKATDVSLFGVEVARTTTTLDPTALRHDQQLIENQLFGRGWRGSFPAAPTWVSEFTPSSDGKSGTIQLIGPSGETLTYVKKGDFYVGVGDAADGSTITNDPANDRLIVTDKTGIKTTYIQVAGKWVISRVDTPGGDSSIAYLRDAQGRMERVLAAPARGVTCEQELTAGCRAIEFAYASATTATGIGSGWGDYAGQVKKISFTGFDPVSNAMKTTDMATYAYDTTGRLREVVDPRTGLKTVYYYSAEGRITQLTPPGLAPWRLEYDNHGRLAHLQREAGDVDPTYAVAYDVPIGGETAPLDLSVAKTSTWGQTTNLPHVGTVVFPASHVPSRAADGAYKPMAGDWEYGTLTYMDINGRPVNQAAYGAGAWQISATRYDNNGNVTWSLSPANRLQALTPTADTDPYVTGRSESAQRADLLASHSTYTDDGDVLSTMDPAHLTRLASGALVSARKRLTNVFDEGKPSSATNYHLVTTATTEPLVLDGTATPATTDKHITKYDYDPIKSGDMSGWTLRLATSVTTDMPDQPDIVQRARYDTAGREIERRMPASSGNDAGTMLTHYYTAGAHPSSPACGNKPEWAGWLCRTEAAAQPADGKPATVKTHTYTYYGTVATSTMTSGSAARTTTMIYDAAGRLTRSSLTASSGAENGVPIPETTITYDPATGLETEKTAGTDKIIKGYDSFGRPTSYKDATGNTATATYTIDGQISTTNDGKGSVTFSYNGVDSQGRQERRGLLTKVEADGVGTFTGAYDADKQLTVQTFPNGMAGVSRYDNAGRQSALTYTKNESILLQFRALRDIEGRIGSQTSPGGSEQKYSYDAAGRLLSVRDRSESCTTRVYGFDLNSNRTSLSTYPADETGQCSTSTSAQTEQYTYDTMDRIINAGYSYDDWGRTTKVPASHVSGGGELSIGYFTNDLVASITQAGETSSFTLDPSGRVKTLTKTGGQQTGTIIHHYAGSEDSPAWITEADGSWTRNIVAFSGLNAYHKSDGSSALLLANLHGDVVAEVENSSSATGILRYMENTEYGVKRGDASDDEARYGWLGSKQRSSDAPAGLILMGVRVYNPMTGRFLQVDPLPGGSANAYEYCSADPVNRVDLSGMADKPDWGYGDAKLVDHISRTSKTTYSRPDGPYEEQDWYEIILSKVPLVGDHIKSVQITDYTYFRTEVFTYRQYRTVHRCDGRIQLMACGVLVKKKELITQTRYGTDNHVYRYTRRVIVVHFRNGRMWIDDTGWRLASVQKSGIKWGSWK